MSRPCCIRTHFTASLSSAAVSQAPYRHWLLSACLPADTAGAIAHLPVTPAEIGETGGKRDNHNDSRVFLSGDILADHPECRALAECFQSPETVAALQHATGTSLDGNYLRIEYCQDTRGFWLEPHTDIGAKKFTMLVYLSEAPDAGNWGTDIYDADKRHVGRAPADFNRGLIFIPGEDTWHGFEPRRIDGVRRSIIINYVVPEWRARHELAFPDQPVRAVP